MSHDYLFKFIISGDSSVGKTSLLSRFTDGEFNPSLEATVGVDFKTKSIELDSKEILIMIWDTAGHESFRAFTRSYYRGTAVALVVYDVTNEKSFQHVSHWLQDIRRNCDNPHLEIILVGNKSDVGESQRMITKDEGKTFAKNNGLGFYETSAKSNENVEKLFKTAAERFYQKLRDGHVDVTSDVQGITLGPGQFKAKGKCQC